MKTNLGRVLRCCRFERLGNGILQLLAAVSFKSAWLYTALGLRFARRARSTLSSGEG